MSAEPLSLMSSLSSVSAVPFRSIAVARCVRLSIVSSSVEPNVAPDTPIVAVPSPLRMPPPFCSNVKCFTLQLKLASFAESESDGFDAERSTDELIGPSETPPHARPSSVITSMPTTGTSTSIGGSGMCTVASHSQRRRPFSCSQPALRSTWCSSRDGAAEYRSVRKFAVEPTRSKVKAAIATASPSSRARVVLFATSTLRLDVVHD